MAIDAKVDRILGGKGPLKSLWAGVFNCSTLGKAGHKGTKRMLFNIPRYNGDCEGKPKRATKNFGWIQQQKEETTTWDAF